MLKKQEVKQVLQLIIFILGEPTNIDEICKRSFISKQTLFNKFKKAYNITPHQYILRKKIIVSCDMLLNQNLSIAKIAETLKFTDEYAFSHAFKKQLGITPSKYRKNRQI